MEVDLDKLSLVQISGKLLIFKIGSEDHMSTEEDIKQARKMIAKALKGIKNIRVIVTHHAFELDVVPLSEIKYAQKYTGLRNAIEDLEVI